MLSQQQLSECCHQTLVVGAKHQDGTPDVPSCLFGLYCLQGPLLSQQQLSEFCHETLVVAAKYQQDFEKFGIHLSDSQQRAKVAQLLALNQHFPALFNATLVSLSPMELVRCPSAIMSSKHTPLNLMIFSFAIIELLLKPCFWSTPLPFTPPLPWAR